MEIHYQKLMLQRDHNKQICILACQSSVVLMLKTQCVLTATLSMRQRPPITNVHQSGLDQHVLFAMGVGGSSMGEPGPLVGFC